MENLSNSIPAEDCYTTADISSELGVGIQRTRQIIKKAMKTQRVPNLTRQMGSKILFAPQMAQQIITLYKRGALGRVAPKVNPTAGAIMRVTVAIYDPVRAEIIQAKFPTEEKLVEFLRMKLLEAISPISLELTKLEKDFETKKAALLAPEPLFS